MNICRQFYKGLNRHLIFVTTYNRLFCIQSKGSQKKYILIFYRITKYLKVVIITELHYFLSSVFLNICINRKLCSKCCDSNKLYSIHNYFKFWEWITCLQNCVFKLLTVVSVFLYMYSSNAKLDLVSSDVNALQSF